MWWHCAVASRGHPLGSPSESGISRNDMFKVNHSSLADVPQQDSYRALYRTAEVEKVGLSSSIQCLDQAPQSKASLLALWFTKRLSKARLFIAWYTGTVYLWLPHALQPSAHSPLASLCWHRTSFPLVLCTAPHTEISGHGKARVIKTAAVSYLTEPACLCLPS